MSTLIIVPVYALEGSPKVDYAKRTLTNILQNTNLNTHELFISDNGSCAEMLNFYERFKILFAQKFDPDHLTISLNGENLGTSGAVNLGIRKRKPGQFVIKRDDDTIVDVRDWVEQMERVIRMDEKIGIVGLKRRDLIQHPDNPNNDFKSKLRMLNKPEGNRDPWVVVEDTKDIMGTCTMYNPLMLDKCGYAWQISHYGFDDTFWSIRSIRAGFKNCLLHIPIDHIDDGSGSFTQEKRDHVAKIWPEYEEAVHDYEDGLRDIYFDGDFNKDKVQRFVQEHFRPDSPKHKITLITTSSDANHPGWLKFKKSLDHFGWQYELIVHEYRGFNSKIEAFYNFLTENKDRYPHFIYCDSWDCLCLGSPEEVEAKFKNWDALMYGPERACWPIGEWEREFPESPYPHKYLNGGLFMGSSDRFIEMYEKHPITQKNGDDPMWGNDQVWAQDIFLHHNPDGIITLDRECSIFQCIGHMNENEFGVMKVGENPRILNNNTKTLPVFIHGNGHSDMSWVYNLFS